MIRNRHRLFVGVLVQFFSLPALGFFSPFLHSTRWIRGRAVVRGGGLRVSDAGFGGGFGFAAGGVSSGDDGASARGAAVARRDHRERGAGGAVGRRHG